MSDHHVIDYLLTLVNKRRKKPLTKEVIVGYITDPTSDPIAKRKESATKEIKVKSPSKGEVCDYLLKKFNLELKMVREEIIDRVN